MCGCTESFVCSRCAGDLKQDWRLEFKQDQREDDEARREAALSPHPLSEGRRNAA